MFKKDDFTFVNPLETATDILIQQLVQSRPINSEVIEKSYNAALKLAPPMKKGNALTLVDILDHATLKIQQSQFLTADQQERFNELLKDAINLYQNPNGNIDSRLNEVCAEAA